MNTLDDLAVLPEVRVRRRGAPDPEGRGVVYWMQRAQRAQDNRALDVAIRAGNLLRRPVVVFLAPVPNYPNGNLRHYRFLFEGFEELESALGRRGVGLVFRLYPRHRLEPFLDEVRPALLVGDENPLRETEAWRAKVAERVRVPFWTVDTEVVVPSVCLEREQYAARTIRPRIHRLLPTYLVRPPSPRAHIPWSPGRGLARERPTGEVPTDYPLDRRVGGVGDLVGGAKEARRRLRRFVRTGLSGYATARNHPEHDGTSRLSAYLHFGHLGPRALAIAIQQSDAPEVDRAAFLEQLIVRRELAINFVRYNDCYDRLDGCEPWARRTLDEHRLDRRPVSYTLRQLEQAETHDPLWNAAQRQVVDTGWMHGYIRMYWAKKILEWTARPEDAFAIAVELNDRYQLDGRDPNGYASIAWALGGKHDRAWGPPRPVFGTVRFMSFSSTRRKFDSAAYIRRYAGT